MSRNIHITQTDFGWWDNAGRNWFWKLPQVTFKNANDSLIRQGSDQNTIFTQALSEQPEAFIGRLLSNLTGLVSYKGKLKRHKDNACTTIELPGTFFAIVNGDPKDYQQTFRKQVLSDARLSTYSATRPKDSYPD